MHHRHQMLHGRTFFQLNEDEIEILLVDPKALRPLSVKPCEHVNNLGVILDADLTFQRHISNISKTAFLSS